MYIFYKILYSSWFKWVGALAIPAVLIGLWYYAMNQSKVEVANFAQESKDHPNNGQTTVDNYELKEVDDSNSIKWILNARKCIMEAGKGDKDVLLEDVDMKYMDAGTVKMRMTAPTGVANESTHIVNLKSGPKQRVIADGGEGKGRMEANTVELTKRNQFIANGSVNINLPGVAKVTGDRATGALEKTAELKNFRIIGHTHAMLGAMPGVTPAPAI